MDELTRRFTAHDVDQGAKNDMEIIRQRSLLLAESVEKIVPKGREQALALTKLEEAMFWANAGISRAT